VSIRIYVTIIRPFPRGGGLDKIIFLDDGKIEAVGPHDELYTSCPKYRRMVDLQRLEDEAGGDDNA